MAQGHGRRLIVGLLACLGIAYAADPGDTTGVDAPCYAAASRLIAEGHDPGVAHAVMSRCIKLHAIQGERERTMREAQDNDAKTD